MFSILFQSKLKCISKQKVVFVKKHQVFIFENIRTKYFNFEGISHQFYKLVKWNVPGKF